MAEQQIFQFEDSGSIPTSPLQICYQKTMRNKFEKSDIGNLFGKEWKNIDLTLKKTIIKPKDLNKTKTIYY